MPTLLVFTRGKDTESFITASALKVSVPASGRHAYGIELLVYLVTGVCVSTLKIFVSCVMFG